MLTLSTAMAVFVVNFAFRGSYSRPPRWVRVICFKIMAPLCCLRKEARDADVENLVSLVKISLLVYFNRSMVGIQS